MTLLYDLLYGLAVCLGWPWLLVRRWRRGAGSLAIRERLGNVPSRPVSAHCIWIHGVSLGEINATRTLVAEFQRRVPEVALVVSSTTATGLARARELYPKHTVFRFPLDFSFAVSRVFERIRPTVLVLMELELWPNLMEIAARENVRVVIANGRVTSARTMRHFRRPLLRSIARRMFSRVSWVGAQDAEYARCFAELGVPSERIEVTGSLKFDAADLADRVAGSDELAAQMGLDGSAPLLVAGSTGPGEEELLLDAFATLRNSFPNLRMAIVPRKPERFYAVAEAIERRGWICARRSRPPAAALDGPPRIELGDTVGELRKYYCLADVIVIGRSFVPLGGSDLIEAAALGKAVVLGPHMENFSDPTRALLRSGGCVQLAGSGLLAETLRQLLSDAQRRRALADAARATITEQRGATGRTVNRVLRVGRIT